MSEDTDKQKLVLVYSGYNKGCKPDQNPWKPDKTKGVSIYNDSGYPQKLTNITQALLLQPKPNGNGWDPVDEIQLDNGKTWPSETTLGKVANMNGEYSYDDGAPQTPKTPRIGRIDPD